MIELMVSCPEPTGPVLRVVRPLRKTAAELTMVLDKTKDIPNLFDGQSCWKSIDELYDERKTFLLVDNVGLICVAPGHNGSAHVHITFWDRRLRGREGLCRAVAQELFGKGFSYFWTAIPETSRIVLAFAKRVGFREARRFGPSVVLELTRGYLNGT